MFHVNNCVLLNVTVVVLVVREAEGPRAMGVKGLPASKALQGLYLWGNTREDL